jgi:hypothetical protein
VVDAPRRPTPDSGKEVMSYKKETDEAIDKAINESTDREKAKFEEIADKYAKGSKLLRSVIFEGLKITSMNLTSMATALNSSRSNRTVADRDKTDERLHAFIDAFREALPWLLDNHVKDFESVRALVEADPASHANVAVDPAARLN